ncbi:RDD family protein [Catellatospora sp. KI3]|uniref:RDD family protein n=1 Tax=Catellatospora sp. KI3 TaxID=3041620 RepID=UPI0024821683|nr:RDD family protein [Catellatospora sp. KI3]MDI1460859.1 RDD family protein [Catellatospora sp. KI3]
MTRQSHAAAAPTAAGPSTPPELTRADAERILGPRTARRLATFGDGTPYVRAGEGRRILAWLIDFAVYLLAVGAAVVVVSLVRVRSGLSDEAVTVLALSSLFVVPVLYGLCYGDGRALGAVVTGTQLVRVADGGPIGAKACWAMLIRTVLMPALLVVLIAGALAGAGGDAPGGSQVRVSIDRAATRRLRAPGLR